MKKPGVLITFEGLDGCGKTTQLGLQSERLRARGMDVVATAEPGGTAVGRLIREIVLNASTGPIAATAELALMFAARAQHLEEVIDPSLKAGKIILCDRFMDSTVAYQGFGRGVSRKLIGELHNLLCRNARPDLTIYLDISPEAAAARTNTRNRAADQPATRFEDEGRAFFRRVHSGYMDIAAREPERFCVLDGSLDVSAVEHVVNRTVDEFLNRRVDVNFYNSV